jgi:hypothetical protein
MDKCFLHGFIFWFFWVSFPVGDRDERKFTGLSFLDFQDFFSLRERWEESFKDYFSGFSGFSFCIRLRDGRHSPTLFSFFQGSFFWRGERWTRVFHGCFRILRLIGERYGQEVLGFSNSYISGFLVYCISKLQKS